MNWRFFFIVSFFACGSMLSVEKKNVPMFNAQAPHVIRYTTTKELPDGRLKASLLEDLKNFFQISTFVESGTFYGNTTATAAAIFDEVFSIELFPDFYNQALKRFRNYNNVVIKLGDSGEIINKLLPLINKRILFYLDGHYNGGATGKGEKNTPILEELAAIRNSGKVDSLILIDDLCDFQKSAYPEKIKNTCFENYPDLEELIGEILKINPDYQICFLGNALLAFPIVESVTVSPVTSACAQSRISVIPGIFSNDLLYKAEQTIAQAVGSELAELTHYYQAYSDFEYQHGWQSFSSFWYGLIVYHNGNEILARKIFQNTARHSLPGWRVFTWIR